MDDSMINSILISSSIRLKNVEELIKNLEKQTFYVDNLEDNRQEIITKSFSSFSSDTIPINDISDDNFLLKSITFSENLSINSDDQYDKSFESSEQSINKSQQIHSPSNHLSSQKSSSTSWRQMKENQRITTTEIQKKEPRSPFNLYKIFQQKSNLIPSSRQQNNSFISNHINKIRSSIITVSKSKSYNHLTTPTSMSSSSLPDLSFISKYSKELPRSYTTSHLPSISSSSTNIARTTPSPILIHQQIQDSDRPRTLKSIKRYKNSKHSTEPLGIFYSSHLHKTFTVEPTSSSSSQSGRHQILNVKSCLSNNLQNLSQEHYSVYNLTQENQTKNVNFTENISKHFISPCNSSNTFNDQFSLLTKRYGEMRRCQTDIIIADPVLHHYSLTDSPPNEFCLQQDDDEENLIEKSEINIIPNLNESILSFDQSLITMNTLTFDNILERINDIIKRLFEIKRSNKTFILNNEHNLQLDSLLKNDLCTIIQNILEHGRKDLKKITLWKIIQISIEENTSSLEKISPIYYEAKQIAQNISSYWLYKFQAFIFELLNKNELINWLYYFTRQKDIIQRYYQYPDALIFVSISSTFNFFERIMTQLEKLTSITFHLTYYPPLLNDEQLNTSIITNHSIKSNAIDWIMTLSRRTSKNLTQTNSNDTFRTTLSKKFNSIFTKTNTKLPESINQSSSNITFQSKIPRLSLNIDKPKLTRYCSTK